MEKQSRVLMWLVVLVPVLGAILLIIPPQKKLKGGIDLAGGFSLLYEIDTTGLTSQDVRERGGLASRVKDVLQRRVDPNAQLNLVWRPVGATRLEIQMPRPPKEAIERRRAYEAGLEDIRTRNIGRLEVESALGAEPEVRDARLAALVRGVVEREEKLQALKTAYDAYRGLRAGDDIEAEDAAHAAYETAFEALLATSLEPGRLTDVLDIGQAGERAEQLGRLKEQYPSYTALIEEVEAKHAAWAADKAALEDPSDLKRLLRGAGVLEFRILADRDSSNPAMIASSEAALRQQISIYTERLHRFGPRPQGGDHYRWFEVSEIVGFLQVDSRDQVERAAKEGQQIVEKYLGKWYVLAHADPQYGLLKGGLAKWRLKGARPGRDEDGRPAVLFTLDPRGGSQFGTLTEVNKGRQLCIMLDDAAMSHARIQSRITTHGQISGQTFTAEKVQNLVQILEAGSLPGRLKETPLMEKNVGPSLGRTNRLLGFRAAIWGMIAVVGFMPFFYRFGGLVADVALLLNLLFVLATMAALQATFTLQGIAGLVLSLAIAVDANVLIFERFREERAHGTVFKRALRMGYEKALSAIVDSNLTTLISCVVLGYLGSEEVKGFAMTLGFGIVTSMFTALFVTRLIFISLTDLNWLKDLGMMRLIRQPKIDWIGAWRAFWPISLVAWVGGSTLFVWASTADFESVYDIEFLGGTSVQIELKEGVTLTDEDIRERVTSSGTSAVGPSAATWLEQAAAALARAEVTVGTTQAQFVVSSAELTGGQIAALMQTRQRGAARTLVDQLEVGGVTPSASACRFDTRPVQDKAATETEAAVERSMTLEEFKGSVAAAAEYARKAGELLRGAWIQTVFDVGEEATSATARTFEIITVETNKELVKEAVLAVMGDDLAIERPVNFVQVTDQAHPEGYFPVEEDARYLSDVIGGEANFDIRRYKGGVAFVFDQLAPQQTTGQIDKRIREMRLQPGFDESYKWRDYGLFGLTSAGGTGQDERFSKFALVVVDENLPYYDDVARWRENVAQPELQQTVQALQAEKTLRKVIQFAPQVAAQIKNQTILAVAVTLAAIAAYVWIRFSSLQFALAAIVALVHDVFITLGFITLSNYFHGGTLGDWLLLRPFKIDLPMVAAILTILGYSLNDTIVVFDRIRETRGKLTTVNPQMINLSINQTLSRTLLTGVTTILVLAIMYCIGGPGVHGFACTMLMGVVVGTYSSVAVASPLLHQPRLLNVIVYILVALGIVGAVLVISSSLPVRLVLGIIVALGLIAAIATEVRSERGYGELAVSGG